MALVKHGHAVNEFMTWGILWALAAGAVACDDDVMGQASERDVPDAAISTLDDAATADPDDDELDGSVGTSDGGGVAADDSPDARPPGDSDSDAGEQDEAPDAAVGALLDSGAENSDESAADAGQQICVATEESLLEQPRGWYDLHLVASGFDEYEGSLVRVVSGGREGRGVGQARIRDGAFELLVPSVVTDYVSVGVYIDQNEDDACTLGEPTWSRNSGALAGNTGLDVANHRVNMVIRLPLEDCEDCSGAWTRHPIPQPSQDFPHCETGAALDLSMPIACPVR